MTTRLLSLLAALPLIAGCTVVGASYSGPIGGPACPAGLEPAQRAELFLGRGIPGGGTVSDEGVESFLAQTLTPAFPDGLTIIPARGQWRGGDGRIAREESLLVVLLLPGEDAVAARARVEPLAQAWRQRFGQESVLRTLGPACIAF